MRVHDSQAYRKMDVTSSSIYWPQSLCTKCSLSTLPLLLLLTSSGCWLLLLLAESWGLGNYGKWFLSVKMGQGEGRFFSLQTQDTTKMGKMSEIPAVIRIHDDTGHDENGQDEQNAFCDTYP